MPAYDVLIVGGGPAGSSCAWRLRDSGLRVAILDKQSFPRDKVCGGWITPAAVTDLEIDLEEYANGRTLQPITRFRTGAIGGPAIETSYTGVVSYGIRRREFDDYLLKRSNAILLPPAPLTILERSGDGWLVNSDIKARLVVGAGGHFCPVAKFMGARTNGEPAVVAQEIEFEMDPGQMDRCAVDPRAPELYFCRDMRGYGWAFRKGSVLNVGLGRADPAHLSRHLDEFVQFLKSDHRVSFEIPPPKGHAYLLHGTSQREWIGDATLLIGDAAGLAYAQSGEGIRPAIESGLLAADTIAAAQGEYGRDALEPYRAALTDRLGRPRDWSMQAGAWFPPALIGAPAKSLLTTRWFTRNVVLDRWFLHHGEPALPAPRSSRAPAALHV